MGGKLGVEVGQTIGIILGLQEGIVLELLDVKSNDSTQS